MKKQSIFKASPFGVFLGIILLSAVSIIEMRASSGSQELPPRYWEPYTTIFDSPEEIDLWFSHPNAIQDHNGYVHVVWKYQESVPSPDIRGVMYSRRDLNGNWSLPEVLVDRQANDVAVIADLTGTIYVIWTLFQGHLYIVERQEDGSWSEPQVFDTPSFPILSTHVATDGTLYVIGSYPGSFSSGFKLYPYLQRLVGEEWEIQEFPVYNDTFAYDVDSDGVLHIAYPGDGLQYLKRKPGQDWGNPFTIGEINSNVDSLVVDMDGKVHFAWDQIVEYSCPPLTCSKYEMQYATLEEGVLSSKEVIAEYESSPQTNQFAPTEMVTIQGSVHLAWIDSNQARYAYRTPDGKWEIDNKLRPAKWIELLEIPDDQLHFFWSTQFCVVHHQWKWKSVPSEWSSTGIPVPSGPCIGADRPNAHFFGGKESADLDYPQAVYVRPPDPNSPQRVGIKHRSFVAVIPTPTNTPVPTVPATPTITPTITVVPTEIPQPPKVVFLPLIITID